MFNKLSWSIVIGLFIGSIALLFTTNSNFYALFSFIGIVFSGLGAFLISEKTAKKEHEEKIVLGQISLGKIAHFSYTKWSDSNWGTQIYTKDNHTFLIYDELTDLEKNEELFLIGYTGGVSGNVYFQLVRANGKKHNYLKSNFNLEKFNKIFEDQKLKIKDNMKVYS